LASHGHAAHTGLPFAAIVVERYAAWFCIGIVIPMLPFLAHAIPDLVTHGPSDFWKVNLEETYLFVALSAATAVVESRLSRGAGTLLFIGYVAAALFAAVAYLQLVSDQRSEHDYLASMAGRCSAHACSAKSLLPKRPDAVSGATEQIGVVLMFSTAVSYMLYKWVIVQREAKHDVTTEALLRSIRAA
jgi:hypothetical protein